MATEFTTEGASRMAMAHHGFSMQPMSVSIRVYHSFSAMARALRKDLSRNGLDPRVSRKECVAMCVSGSDYPEDPYCRIYLWTGAWLEEGVEHAAAIALATLAHEATHAASWILRAQLGGKALSLGSNGTGFSATFNAREEALCYLVDDIVGRGAVPVLEAVEELLAETKRAARAARRRELRAA